MELQTLLESQQLQFEKSLELLDALIDQNVLQTTLFTGERELIFRIPHQIGVQIIENRSKMLNSIIHRLSRKYFVRKIDDITLYINWTSEKETKESQLG